MSLSSTNPSEPQANSSVEGERLQKVLAAAGVASRRVCEDMIADGRVSVNGRVVDRMGARIDPIMDLVHVDGMRVVLDPSKVYIALHKPRDVLSAMSDDRGRRTVADLLNTESRVFHVGRLDLDSEGLLLFTNDGELANRLSHPSYEISKTYICEVPGPVWPKIGRQLLAGVELEDGVAVADRFRVVESFEGRAMIEIVLHSGKNRIVRRMMEAVGHPVHRLIRTQVGSVRLGSLPPGKQRALSKDEVGQLYAAVGM